MKFSVKKVVAAAAAIALIGSMTAMAAGRLASREAHSDLRDQVTDYSKLNRIEAEAGFVFPAVEEFSNGFRFVSAVPSDNSDYDEEGNVLSSYKGVALNYTDGSQDVSVYIYQSRSYDDGNASNAPGITPVWEGEKDGLNLRVTRTVFKFVPPDYELTQEDLAAQESGSVVFSYGSSSVREQVSYNCVLEKGGLSYDLLGFDLTMEPEELAGMAAELLTLGE